MTLEVFGTYPAQTTEPPKDVRAVISARHPGWSWRDFS
jgi:sarcosine oxidase subunit delta